MKNTIVLITGIIVGTLLGYFLFSGKNTGLVRPFKAVLNTKEILHGDSIHFSKDGKVMLYEKGLETNLNIDQLARIEFLEPEKTVIPDNNKPSFNKDINGKWKISVAGYKGMLIIQHPRGTIQFENWGKNAKESINSLKINGQDISFVRSCVGAECNRIGAPGPFRQNFTGKIIAPTKIEGNYTGTGSSGAWKAER